MGAINHVFLVGEVKEITEEFEHGGDNFVSVVMQLQSGKLINARGKKELLVIDGLTHKFQGEIRTRKEEKGNAEFFWVQRILPVEAMENEVYLCGKLYSKKPMAKTKQDVPVINFKMIIKNPTNDKLYNIISCEAYANNAVIIDAMDVTTSLVVAGRMSSLARNENTYNSVYVKTVSAL